MLEHHKISLDNLINYFKDDTNIISIILGGSIAKGCERADSDIDAIIVVTEEKYKILEKEDRLSECIYKYCTYKNGYFDIKYTTLNYLKAVAQNGSEPSRNAFVSSKCVYGDNEEVKKLIEQIPIFQKSEKKDKMLSFYSAFSLNYRYFFGASLNNPYLKIRASSDIVLFGLRLILQENEVLFPCHKALFQTVSKLENTANVLFLANEFLSNLTKESKDCFVNSVLEFIDYTPPENYEKVLSRFIDDNELWWYKQRPNIAEW